MTTEKEIDIIAIVQRAIKEKSLLISKEDWEKCETFMKQALMMYVLPQCDTIEHFQQVLPAEVINCEDFLKKVNSSNND
jgi:hypothetical protein